MKFVLNPFFDSLIPKMAGYVSHMPLSAAISHSLVKGIVMLAEPCKCVTLLISRII